MIAKTTPAREHGLTLIELVVFIVIVGIAAFALLGSFGALLPRSPTPAQLTQAAQLAQERMELILGQRDRPFSGGYNNMVDLDPCNVGTPAVCTNAYGYTVASAGTGTAPASWVPWNGNPTTSYKLVTVTVSLAGTTLATQSVVFSNY